MQYEEVASPGKSAAIAGGAAPCVVCTEISSLLKGRSVTWIWPSARLSHLALPYWQFSPILDANIYADRLAKKMIGIGCALIVVALVPALKFGGVGLGGGVFSASLMLIATGKSRRSNAYLRFDAGHFETKLTLASGRQKVLYSAVTSCDVSDKLVVVHYREHGQPAGSKPKRIYIPLGELRADDRPLCIDAFRTRLRSASSA
ncbi:hypothetical protein [Cupriavidus sp. USMAHM13]|uniref:hypothetical protein n=1 Tax=Cupriavidus sp. USMAHM13 TaxID=1389192 RepID=UPI0012EA11BC|nr:hypothetical protein [Cupriavidus sp. USMAHM13]